MRTYALLYGRKRAAEDFGISRHTLWRFLERGQMGRALPNAVLNSVGADGDVPNSSKVAALDDSRRRIITDLVRQEFDGLRLLPQRLEETLLLLCSTPFTTVRELSNFGRVPASTLHDRLEKLIERGLVDSIPHRLSVLGSNSQRRYFPTRSGVASGGGATRGQQYFLRNYPVSRQWFRLLAERLDAIAVTYHVASLVAEVDPHNEPVSVDHYRQGPYDALLTLAGGCTIGLIRQGPVLPTSNLRYRLRSTERLSYGKQPLVTLVLAYSDQATRRAIRSLGDPNEHRTTFVATEGDIIAGGARSPVWQQCGAGRGDNPGVMIDPDASLEGILAWTDRLLNGAYRSYREYPKPNRATLYPSDVRATMPDSSRQMASSLSAQLTRADKDVLDLLAAWPLCTREQLAGLMGGVTRRRANQVLRSLMQRDLARADGPLHVLTDEGLTYLARRDRAAVGQMLDRWSAEPSSFDPEIYAGSAMRAIASQLQHHAGIVDFAAALSAEAAHTKDYEYEVFDLLPTSRSSAGYYYQGTDFVVHPDASFLLTYLGVSRPCFLEFERRATTPRRVPERLESYRRYFRSGWAKHDHGGLFPRVLFVFETPSEEDTFLDVASRHDRAPLFTSNSETLAEHGVLGTSWRLPPPHPPDRTLLRSLRVTD